MICEKCFKQIDDDSRFCIYCGASLTILENYSKGNLITFSHNKKWGFKDKDTREIVVPLKYDFIGKFSDDKAVIMINFKYGYVDKNGKEITRLKYDFAKESKDGYAPVKRDDKWSIVDINCSEISPFKYDSVDYFQGDFAHASINNKFVLINKKGEEITKRFYDKIGEFNENLQIASKDFYQKEEDVEYTCSICNSPVDKDDKYCKNCNADLSEVIYEGEQVNKVFNENIALVKLNKKYGVIDNKGDEIIPLIYDSIEYFPDGMLKVKENHKYGILAKNGGKLISCSYDEMIKLPNSVYKLTLNNKLGFFFLSAKLIDCLYDELKILKDGTLAVKDESKWIAFNNLGEDVSRKNLDFLDFLSDKKRRKRKKTIFAITISFFLFLFFLIVLDASTGEVGIIREIKILIQGEEEFTWDEIKNSSTIENLQQYLLNYPNGKYKTAAEDRIENFIWNEATKENTIDAYNDYVKKYPMGKYKSKSDYAKEDIIWEEAKNSYTIKSFRQYLRNYPKGQYSTIAQMEIKFIKSKNESSIARVNADNAYRDYMYNSLNPNQEFTSTLIKNILLNNHYVIDGMELNSINGDVRIAWDAYCSIELLNTNLTYFDKYLLRFQGNFGGGNSEWAYLCLVELINIQPVILDKLMYGGGQTIVQEDSYIVYDYEWLSTDAHCCPSYKIERVIKIQNNKFIEISRRKIKNQ